MNLGIDSYTWQDLSSYDRLKDLALTFDELVREHDAELFAKFDLYRHHVQSGAPNGGLTPPEESALLISVGRELGQFLTQLFRIQPTVAAQQARALRDSEVARFKREFVAKRVAKMVNAGAVPRGSSGSSGSSGAQDGAATPRNSEEPPPPRPSSAPSPARRPTRSSPSRRRQTGSSTSRRTTRAGRRSTRPRVRRSMRSASCARASTPRSSEKR